MILSTASAVIAKMDFLARFRRWGLASNPLIMRLRRQQTRLTLRGSLWLAASLGALALVYTIQAVRHTSGIQMNWLDSMLLLGGWLLTVTAPILTASSSVYIVARETQSEPYDLLRLTPLSGHTLVRGYVFTTLYRLRFLYILLVGIMPLLVVRMSSMLWEAETRYQLAYNSPSMLSGADGQRLEWEVIILLPLGWLALILILWGMNLLAAAWGVRTVMGGAAAAWAAFTVPMSVCGLMLCLCLGGSFLTFVLSGAFGGATNQLVVMVVIAIPVLLLPYELALSQMWQAGHRYNQLHN